MKLDIRKRSEIKRDIKIEVDEANLKSIRDKTLDKINQSVSIPGFRKGKAPHGLVEKRFSDLVRDELLKEAIPFYYRRALEQEKLETAGMPNIRDAHYSQGRLSFVAEVELKPKVDIDEKVYRNIKLKITPIKVEDKEIEKFIDQLKESLAQVLKKNRQDIENKLVANWAGYKDEEEFKKAIYSELHLSKTVQRRRDFEKVITDTLLSKVKFELPQSVLNQQKERLMSQQLMDLRLKGIGEEEINKHHDEISRKTETISKEQVKLYYILEEIAKKENLKVQNDSLYQAVVGFILSNCLK